MKYSAIIFDFDGTIVDSAPGVIACFRHIMTPQQGLVWTDAEIRSLIGTPLRMILQKLLATEDKKIIKDGVTAFRVYYPRHGLKNYTVFPDMVGMLQNLVENGIKLFIVSNKFEMFIHPILIQSNLDKYFTGIIGATEKDPPDKSFLVARCIQLYDVDKKTTAMVGDAAGDMVAGKKNGLFSIGVTYGYGTKKILQNADADITVQTVRALTKLLLSPEHLNNVSKV